MVALPFSGGREQSGERPAVVIQDTAYGQGSPLVLIVLLTSQLAALRFPASVRVEPTLSNGLNLPSVAMVFQTRALDRSRFLRRIGAVTDEALSSILSELDQLTGR
jgi:mRNA interferase MazF